LLCANWRTTMLYKLGASGGIFNTLELVPFSDFSHFGNLEKHLEDLIASSILDVLFEDSSLMPIFQERQRQAEADIYALNEAGDLIIFELKRSSAGEGAVHQALRYTQDAGQWSYSKLQHKYHQYSSETSDLITSHQEAFNLEHPLNAKEINKSQHLIVIGSAADGSLIGAIDYWKKQGVSIEFLPYRIYELHGEHYFEFFSMPYDIHRNPNDVKGVLFDTNRSYDEESIWYMMEKRRVAAFGDSKRFVRYVDTGDYVFFTHKWVGLVAAAKVKKGEVKSPNKRTLYRDVEFLTPIPQKEEPLVGMPFKMVSEITGRSFFWARTIKVPYLSQNESLNLVDELNLFFENCT